MKNYFSKHDGDQLKKTFKVMFKLCSQHTFTQTYTMNADLHKHMQMQYISPYTLDTYVPTHLHKCTHTRKDKGKHCYFIFCLGTADEYLILQI